jgi:competence protein ComEC
MAKKIFAFLILYYFFVLIRASFYQNKVVIFNVGQGDSIYISDSSHKIIIDGGPDFTLSYKLSFLPICNIDAVFISHPHKDHIEGILRILKRCNVENVYYNDFGNIDSSLTKNTKNVFIGDIVRLGDLNFRILWPRADLVTSNPNIESLVLLLNERFLFTADAETEVLQQLPIVNLNLELLKVPHQGANDAFYKPLYLSNTIDLNVISVGKNSYGHPSPDLVKFFEDHNFKYYRTDIHDDILVDLR